jgi:hypothetical protein
MVKRNIGQFSGFAWSEKEEEKQRARIKEKIDKCVKEKLIVFCDVLDIPISRSNVKKEELAVKVLEFLESPKETRDVIIADQEKVLLESVHYCSTCSFSMGALNSFLAGEKAQEYTKKGEIWRIFGHPCQEEKAN